MLELSEVYKSSLQSKGACFTYEFFNDMPYLISFEFYLKLISYQFENLKMRFIIFIILTGYFFNIKMHGKKRQKEHKLSFSLNMLKE